MYIKFVKVYEVISLRKIVERFVSFVRILYML